MVAAIIAVQLPQPARAGEAGARARRRLHRRAQGRPGHAADHAGARRADRRAHRHPGRRGQRARVRRIPKSVRSLTTHPDVDMVTFTGSTADRPPHHGGRQRHRQAGLPRARRQVRDHRARRRRLRAPPRCSPRSASAPTPARAARSPHGCWCRASTTTRSSRWSRPNFSPRPLRRSDRPEDLHGSADQRAPARQGRRHGASAPSQPARRSSPAASKSDPGLLLHPDAADRRRPRAARSPRRRSSDRSSS